jgi:hypothetical protein
MFFYSIWVIVETVALQGPVIYVYVFKNSQVSTQYSMHSPIATV